MLDEVMMKRTTSQIILLLVFATVVFGTLLGIYMAFGQNIDLPHLAALFSQSVNVEDKPEKQQEYDILKYLSQMVIYLIGTVCFSSFLISTISNIIQRRVDAYSKGEVRYKNLSGHGIIIGANELLEPALRHLMFVEGKRIEKGYENKKKAKRKVLVVTSLDAEEVRTRVRQMGLIKEKQLIIYQDNIFSKTRKKRVRETFANCKWVKKMFHINEQPTYDDTNILRLLNISQCCQCVIIGDEQMEQCDINNTNIAERIFSFLQLPSQKEKRAKQSDTSRGTKKVVAVNNTPVYVSCFDDSFFLSFCKKIKEVKDCGVYFYPFNYYEIWIAKVWCYGQLNKILSKTQCDWESLSQRTEDGLLHLFILGFDTMGKEALKAAVKWAHFASPEKRRTKVSVYTSHKEEIDRFLLRYPNLRGTLFDMDISYYIQSPYEDSTMAALIDAAQSGERLYVVICTSTDDSSFMLATHLPMEIYRKHVPVLAHIRRTSENINDFPNGDKQENERFKNVHFFGYFNNSMPFTITFEIAQAQLYFHKNEGLKAKEQWERKPYNDVRQTLVSCSLGLAILFEELGLDVVKGEGEKVEIKGEEAYDILQRMYMGWYTVAGYCPTKFPTDTDDPTYGLRNDLFIYQRLKRANTEQYQNRERRMIEYFNEIDKWLESEGKHLEWKNRSK